VLGKALVAVLEIIITYNINKMIKEAPGKYFEKYERYGKTFQTKVV